MTAFPSISESTLTFAYAQNIPYFPLIDLISKAIHIDESDSPDIVKEKLESSIDVLLGNKKWEKRCALRL